MKTVARSSRAKKAKEKEKAWCTGQDGVLLIEKYCFLNVLVVTAVVVNYASYSLIKWESMDVSQSFFRSFALTKSPRGRTGWGESRQHDFFGRVLPTNRSSNGILKNIQETQHV